MYEKHCTVRNKLSNTFSCLSAGKLTVAWFGGSISCGGQASDKEKNSFRALVTDWLKREYPKAEITAVNASIGGTGSDYAAYRVDGDLIPKSPNLVFVEYPVNDHYPAVNTLSSIISHYESIVVKLLRANPYTDIVVLLTNERSTMESPDYFAKVAHDKVAEHYGLSTLRIGDALGEAIGDTKNDVCWNKYFNDPYHPLDAGHKVYAEVIEEFIARCQKDGGNAVYEKHEIPSPMSEVTHFDTALIDGTALSTTGEWEEAGRSIKSSHKGDIACCEFVGQSVSLMVRCAPNAGILRYSIDGGEREGTLDLYCGFGFSPKLTLSQGTGLDKEKTHTIEITVTGDANEKAVGCEISVNSVLIDR